MGPYTLHPTPMAAPPQIHFQNCVINDTIKGFSRFDKSNIKLRAISQKNVRLIT